MLQEIVCGHAGSREAFRERPAGGSGVRGRADGAVLAGPMEGAADEMPPPGPDSRWAWKSGPGLRLLALFRPLRSLSYAVGGGGGSGAMPLGGLGAAAPAAAARRPRKTQSAVGGRLAGSPERCERVFVLQCLWEGCREIRRG